MKEFKYKSNPDEFKSVKETTYNERYKSFRRINFPRIIYFMVLIAIGVLLVLYFAERSVFVKGEGLVLSDNIKITIDEDIEIMNINYNEGEKIKVGDTLIAYCSKGQAKIGKEYLSRLSKVESSYTKDKVDYRKVIGLREIKRNHYKRKIKAGINYLNTLKGEVKLNISKDDEIKKLKEKINDYKLELRLIETEIAYLRNELGVKGKSYVITRDSLTENYYSIMNKSYIKTPVAGTIKKVLKKKGMQAYRNDPVIEINNGEGVAVIAYFSQKDLHYLNLDTEVKVYFSDGETSYGRISEISEPVISYNSEGEPNLGKDMKIKVKISPDLSEVERWNARKGYFVVIKKIRNFFN